jgi:hypothetical protein
MHQRRDCGDAVAEGVRYAAERPGDVEQDQHRCRGHRDHGRLTYFAPDSRAEAAIGVLDQRAKLRFQRLAQRFFLRGIDRLKLDLHGRVIVDREDSRVIVARVDKNLTHSGWLHRLLEADLPDGAARIVDAQR